MPGPPKKPTSLKLLHGTYMGDRPNEVRPESAIPEIPAHLSPEAKAEWARVAEELSMLDLLTRIDRAALAAYCECWSDWVEASRMCATSEDGKDRKVIRTEAGNFIENPYYSIKKRSLELMHKFLIEFGMSPASRGRIDVDSGVKVKNKPTGTTTGRFFDRSR